MKALVFATGLDFAALGASAQPADRACALTLKATNFRTQAAWLRAGDASSGLWRRIKPRADANGPGQSRLAEQRARLKTRDARCEVGRATCEGGPVAPLVAWNCIENMTARRNADSRAMM